MRNASRGAFPRATAGALAWICVLAAVGSADTIKVAPGDDVQAAIMAAQPGDTVLLKKGTHTGNLFIPPSKGELELKGQSGTVLDAHAGDHGVIVLAPKVTISRLTIIHALDTGVVVPGGGSPIDGFTLDRVVVLGALGFGVTVNADDAVLTRSEVRGSGAGFSVRGARASVSRCTVQNVEAAGIEVEGADAVIERCTIDCVSGGSGVFVTGEAARLTSNRVCRTIEEGLLVIGGDSVIERNRLSTVNGPGILVEGVGALIERNSLDGTAGTAIDAQVGEALTVHRNRVDCSLAMGIQSQADFGVFSNNKLRGSGVQGKSGIWVVGDGNLVSGNLVSGCVDRGLYVSGDDNEVLSNTLSSNVDDGLLVATNSSDGCRVEGNSIKGNHGEGLHNEGVGTTFADNRFSSNRIDVANDAENDATLVDGGGNHYSGEVVQPEID
jgi:parallel beta-helix repeat protein